jgi:hypothetical protein
VLVPAADLVRRLVFGRVYSIGIFAGPSPLELRPAHGIENPVLTRDAVVDAFAAYVADPFLVHVGSTWNLFFEILNWKRGGRRGEIALATSRDGKRFTYQGIVLAEPFHLSFPYVFTSGSDQYMIPESSAAGAVRLYRADPFPHRWVLVKTLLAGPVHYDNCVFQHDGRWWILTHTDTRAGTLRLFQAPELTGPWSEHPRSPVVAADARIARPAGRVVSMSGRLLRFAQDCRMAYGSSVSALEITRLTATEYEERVLPGTPVLAGSGQGWNALGMHHVDAHQLEDGSWIACVDGWRDRVRRPGEIARWGRDQWGGARQRFDPLFRAR